MGKTLLAACFITDFGTVLALGILFADFNVWLVVFVAVTAVMLWFMPKWTQYLITRLGATRVSEPEVKFIFLVLFFLGGLASTAKSEAVLPAYLLGLVVAGVFLRDKTLVHRMRSIAFAIFTPFYFIKAGLFVSLPALAAAVGVIAVLLALKMVTKFVGVWPLSRVFLHALRRGELHGVADVHRADLRHDFGVVRAAEQDHRPAAVFGAGDGRDSERVLPDAHRAEVFPADHPDDGGLGPAVPTQDQRQVQRPAAQSDGK